MNRTRNRFGTIVVALLAGIIIAAPTFSQEKRIETNPFFGYAFLARFTPAYIKSDAAGLWCGF
jgi:hypothetical protein